MAIKKSIQEIELENRISIEEYFNTRVVGLKKGIRKISTVQPTSICPFHDEADPSFHYWGSRKLVHCFGCGVTGNIVRLHQLIESTYHGHIMDKTEAINDLIRIYGLKGIIQDAIEAQEEPQTAFEKARQKLEDGMATVIPADTFTITKFRKTNDMLIKAQMSDEARIKEFSNIDRLAGLVISGVVEN